MIIYKATNTNNGHVYIGQTIKTLEERKKQHNKDCKYNRSGMIFHKALLKHGSDKFRWEVLVKSDSKNKLNALERFYIAAYRKMAILYNMTDGGEGTFGYLPTKETIFKLSESHKGKKQSRESIRKMLETKIKKGTNKHSEETKNKISIAQIGRKASSETIKKLRESHIGIRPSAETIEKRKGRIPWNKGKNISRESILKRTETRRKNGWDHRTNAE